MSSRTFVEACMSMTLHDRNALKKLDRQPADMQQPPVRNVTSSSLAAILQTVLVNIQQLQNSVAALDKKVTRLLQAQQANLQNASKRAEEEAMAAWKGIFREIMNRKFLVNGQFLSVLCKKNDLHYQPTAAQFSRILETVLAEGLGGMIPVPDGVEVVTYESTYKAQLLAEVNV